MPTATKNNPSNRPLNGSISASSSCRNSESASSTREKCAERHRQPDLLHEERRPDHEQQRGSGEDVAALWLAMNLSAGRTTRRPCDARDAPLGRRCPVGPGVRSFAAQERQKRQQRDHRKILEEQHGE